MANYTITLDDLKDYLQTLGAQDSVGITGSTARCFVANALNHKYKQPFLVDGAGFAESGSAVPWTPLTPDVRDILSKFDDISYDFKSVTREQIEEAIPELRKENNGE